MHIKEVILRLIGGDLEDLKSQRRFGGMDKTQKGLQRMHAEALCILWCRDQESNQGHTDFQSVALPTELSRHSRLN